MEREEREEAEVLGAEAVEEEVEREEVEVPVEEEVEVVEEPDGAAEEPAPNFPCVSCDQRFATKRHMGAHVIAAHPHIVPRCEQCEATFYTKKQLKQHVRRVHSETGFRCPRCKVDIRHKSNLPGHERTCHGGQPRQAKPYGDCSTATKYRRINL